MVPQIVHPRTQEFFAHWRALPRRSGLIVPHNDDFLDQAPVRLMNNVFIHEIVGDSLLVRFMGTELVQRWQRDDTGQEFGGNLPPSAKLRLVSITKMLTGHPCGVLQHGMMGTSSGREATFEGLLLPLAVDGSAPPRVIVFSALLDQLDRKEHGNKFASAGERSWIDIGAGVPETPPPSQR